MTFRTPCFLLALLTLTGCDAAGEWLKGDIAPAERQLPAPPATPVEPTVVTDSDSLASPTRIALVAGHLVVLDFNGNTPIRIVDPSNGSLVASFGAKGGGPGEFESAWAVEPAAGSRHAFWVYDPSQSRMSRVRFDPAAGTAALDTLVNLVSDAIVLQPMSVGGKRIATGMFSARRFAVIDSAGRVGAHFGPPPHGPDDVPVAVRQEAYQGTIARHPSEPLFVSVTRHSDRVEIFRTDGSVVAAAARPLSFDPQIAALEGPQGPTFASDADLRFGYLDVAATETAIYALYSGRTRRGFPGRASYGEYVHVYDWGARLVAILRLPEEALALAADPVTESLFVIHHAPKPLIARYGVRSFGGVAQNSL